MKKKKDRSVWACGWQLVRGGFRTSGPAECFWGHSTESEIVPFLVNHIFLFFFAVGL